MVEREAAAFYGRRDARAARLSVQRDFTFRGRVSALVFSRSIEIQAGFYCPFAGAAKLREQLYGFASLSAGALRAHSGSRALGTASFPPRATARPLALLSTGGGRHLIAVIVARRHTHGRRAGAAREKWPETSLAPSRSHPQHGINDRKLGNCVFSPRALAPRAPVLTSGISFFLRGYQAKCH